MKYSDFKKLFLAPRTNRKNLIHAMKRSFIDLNDLSKFEKQFRKELKPFVSLLNNALYGLNPLPKTYDVLNKSESGYFTGSLKSELIWLVKSLVKYKDAINTFLELQQEFEYSFLSGNYEKARSILFRIDNELCVSLWGIESRFILDEYEKGTEENWNSRKLFMKEGIDPFVQSFSNIFSLRSEKNISFYQFNIEIDKWLHVQGIADNTELLGLNEYLRFKGNYFSFDNYSQFPFFIFQVSGGAIIDKYLLFKNVCSHLLSSENYNTIVFDSLNYILKDINDPALRNILISDNSYKPENLSIYDYKYLNTVDLYTSGEYNDVIKRIGKCFSDFRTAELQIIEIYVKSLCELGLEYKNLCSIPSILDDIGNSIHSVFMKRPETEDALIKLLNYSYLFGNSKNGLFIYNFISEQLGWQNQINYKFLFSSNCTFINPIMFSSSQEKNLNQFKEVNDSLTVQLINKQFDINGLTSINKGKIPKIKKELYKARFFMRSKNIVEAKKIYLRLIEYPSSSIVSQYELYSKLFDCHIQEEEYREAIKLFVRVNVRNPNLTRQMDYDKVLHGVIQGKFKNVGDKSSLIELPIFFRINSSNRIRIKQSLELFLNSINCNYPSEVMSLAGNYSKDDILYFFTNVCSVEILQLSKAFGSTFFVNEERIKICKFLAEMDLENSDRYKIEIADLTQRNTINKVIAKIDERKIYVNEEKLKKSVDKVQKQNVFQNESISPLNQESFDRYVKLNKYIKENNEYRNISPVSFNESGEIQVSDETYLDSFDVIFYYPAFQVFSTFFLYVRDLFVFNKENGLDTYLSTKIRHGTLPNHLRSVFETNHLVTTQSNEEYVENEFWTEKLGLDSNKNEMLQLFLSSFSMNIDNYSKQIKDEFIQCKSESNLSYPNAEFDYTYSEQDQIHLYIKKFHDLYDLDAFKEQVFGELWSKTELILEKVRNKFNDVYRDSFLGFLGQLENELTSNFEKHEINELLSQIMTCRTDIQHKLNNISQWFRRSESTYEGEYKVDVLAQTSIEITKNIHPNYSFNIETELNSSATVKGEYHEHFIDLLNNCLFNMIKHSQLTSDNLNARLKIQEKDGLLVLIFTNNVSEINEHIAKLTEIKANWKKLDSNIAQERGTGFPKIKKIISSDLNRKNSYFNFSSEGNNIIIELNFELNDL